jgi:hypothetical protein
MASFAQEAQRFLPPTKLFYTATSLLTKPVAPLVGHAPHIRTAPPCGVLGPVRRGTNSRKATTKSLGSSAFSAPPLTRHCPGRAVPISTAASHSAVPVARLRRVSLINPLRFALNPSPRSPAWLPASCSA